MANKVTEWKIVGPSLSDSELEKMAEEVEAEMFEALMHEMWGADRVREDAE